LNLKRLILYGGGLGLLALVIGGLLYLGLQNPDDDGETFDAEQPLGPGFVFLDGQWQRAPFYVETDASVIRINARIARRITRLETDEAAADYQPEGSLGELLEAAAMHYEDTGGAASAPPSEERLAELIQFVEALPGATDVSFQEPALAITDEAGETGYVILQRPDPLTNFQNVRLLQATTTRWLEATRRGDVLLFSGDVTVEVSASQSVDFLNALLAVFDLPEAEQSEAMLDLIGEPTLSADLLAAGRPPPMVTDRLAAITPLDSPLVSLAGAEAGSAGEPGSLGTPGSNKAYIFQPIEVEGPDWCFPDPVIEAALSHGYQVIHLRGKASTLDAAVASAGRAGLLYVCGHWHAVEPMATRADALFKIARYREEYGLSNEDVYPVVSVHTRNSQLVPMPQYYVGAGASFYEKRWSSAASVLFLAQCHSADLAAGFDVREFLAIDGQCFSVESERDLEAAFFGELERGEGEAPATIGAAFDVFPPESGWTLQGSGMTVLSPSVTEYAPTDSVPAVSEAAITGHVSFDAPIYQDLPAVLENVVRVEGCGAAVTGSRWLDARTLEFDFVTGQPAEDEEGDGESSTQLTITVDSAWAASAGSPWIKLAGNGEDFSWTLDCTD
jgi:hypothetical protein